MVDEFIFYDEVLYSKGSWRNRNQIKTANGLKWLTIPLQKRNISEQKISEVTTAGNTWRKAHWSALRSNYHQSAYFDLYEDMIKEVYDADENSLSAINQSFIKLIANILDIKTPILNSSSFALTGDKNEKLINLCKDRNASVYLSGPAAKSYLDENLFKEEGIAVEWMNYDDYPVYNQLFPPFIHEVTILDLIFNEGPGAIKFMKSRKRP